MLVDEARTRIDRQLSNNDNLDVKAAAVLAAVGAVVAIVVAVALTGEGWGRPGLFRSSSPPLPQWPRPSPWSPGSTIPAYFKDPELTNVLFVVPDDRRVGRLRQMLWQATPPRLQRRTCTFWVASAESLWSAGPLAPLWPTWVSRASGPRSGRLGRTRSPNGWYGR
jgi:hypothetical protein